MFPKNYVRIKMTQGVLQQSGPPFRGCTVCIRLSYKRVISVLAEAGILTATCIPFRISLIVGLDLVEVLISNFRAVETEIFWWVLGSSNSEGAP